MSQDRKPVYVGEGLKRALKGAPGTLSTNVNLFADRYMEIVDRLKPADITEDDERIMRAAIAQARGHRLEGREIATFPAMVEDWIARNAKDKLASILLDWLKGAEFAELVSIVDWLERQP